LLRRCCAERDALEDRLFPPLVDPFARRDDALVGVFLRARVVVAPADFARREPFPRAAVDGRLVVDFFLAELVVFRVLLVFVAIVSSIAKTNHTSTLGKSAGDYRPVGGHGLPIE
jgi:hypothetical protein